MASQDDNEERSESEEQDESTGESNVESNEPYREPAPDEPVQAAPTQLGAAKYVHAAFFSAAILVAFISGKLLLAAWNRLSEWEAAVHAVPQLVSFPEDQRDSLSMVFGALVGIITVIQSYRKERIRRWADEVASELSRVTWPNKDLVSNGTLVVIVASAIATVYVAILDQFWQFLTHLIYKT